MTLRRFKYRLRRQVEFVLLIILFAEVVKLLISLDLCRFFDACAVKAAQYSDSIPIELLYYLD